MRKTPSLTIGAALIVALLNSGLAIAQPAGLPELLASRISEELECFEGNYYVRDRFALGVAFARAQLPDS
jgi:hypothetical protein